MKACSNSAVSTKNHPNHASQCIVFKLTHADVVLQSCTVNPKNCDPWVLFNRHLVFTQSIYRIIMIYLSILMSHNSYQPYSQYNTSPKSSIYRLLHPYPIPYFSVQTSQRNITNKTPIKYIQSMANDYFHSFTQYAHKSPPDPPARSLRWCGAVAPGWRCRRGCGGHGPSTRQTTCKYLGCYMVHDAVIMSL